MVVPTVTHGNGMVVATDVGKPFVGHQQNLPGGLLNHAVDKTMASSKAQAQHAKLAGVTQRGGGDIITVPKVAEGGTIPGVSFGSNHANLIGGLNQLKANQTYDHLAGTQPYKVGGRKRRRKTKRHGTSKSSNRRRTLRRISRHTKRRNRSTK